MYVILCYIYYICLYIYKHGEEYLKVLNELTISIADSTPEKVHALTI